MQRIILSLAVSLAAVPVLAAAQSSPADSRLYADKNGDGQVTLAEYQTSRRDFVMAGDTNKDGKVTTAEWVKAADRVRQELELEGVDGANKIGNGGWFTIIDANKDSVLTAAEVDAMTKARFAKLDLDKNGRVTNAEAVKLNPRLAAVRAN